jgi:hypothetical protein
MADTKSVIRYLTGRRHVGDDRGWVADVLAPDSAGRHLGFQSVQCPRIEAGTTKISSGTPGGTRTPKLLIRGDTVFVPAGTTQCRFVMSCMAFRRSPCCHVPSRIDQYHNVGLQVGCNDPLKPPHIWAGEKPSLGRPYCRICAPELTA